MTKRIVSTLVILLVLAVAGAAVAQDNGFAGEAPQTETLVGQPQDTYGTAALTVYTLPATKFTGRTNGVTWNSTGGLDRFITAGGTMESSPMIPNGAQIERIELRACDTDAVQQVALNFGPCPTGGSPCNLVGTAATGGAATPGCSNFSTTLASPLIINNQSTPILVSVSTGPTSTTSFSSVKLYYRLRVSPAPATATFPNDVPTSHIFFRYVEALASAGITGGCGPGSFCPDSPVTRGQMAAFLSLALGLHFPN